MKAAGSTLLLKDVFNFFYLPRFLVKTIHKVLCIKTLKLFRYTWLHCICTHFLQTKLTNKHFFCWQRYFFTCCYSNFHEHCENFFRTLQPLKNCHKSQAIYAVKHASINFHESWKYFFLCSYMNVCYVSTYYNFNVEYRLKIETNQQHSHSDSVAIV